MYLTTENATADCARSAERPTAGEPGGAPSAGPARPAAPPPARGPARAGDARVAPEPAARPGRRDKRRAPPLRHAPREHEDVVRPRGQDHDERGCQEKDQVRVRRQRILLYRVQNLETAAGSAGPRTPTVGQRRPG